MDTALVLKIPQAEHVVSRWRMLHDPAAAAGMPAHVTLLHPFRSFKEIDDAAQATLAHLFAQSAPIELRFAEARRFPAVLWLAPQNPAPVVALVRALGLAFPDCLPYGGAHPDTVPHLTVAHLQAHETTEADLDRIRAEFLAETRKRFPLDARVEEASLFHKRDDGWHEVRQFRLGRA
jgi:hypothetical protein